MAVYVYDKEHGCMVDKKTGEPMLNHFERGRPLQLPKVVSDIEGYHSPIDGSWVEGRRARRYDMEKNGCVDANDLRTEKKLKNESFVKKRGLEHLT